MPIEKIYPLVVDDDDSLRKSLCAVLAESGYRVHSAEDGFTALVELRNSLPVILLSDLNMPGMSGFEFLSVVRRRFPAVRTIAMSGAGSGTEVPVGVPAAAFDEKGTSLTALLRVIDNMSQPERCQPRHYHGALAPIWIARNRHDTRGEPSVMISCPECLRATCATILGETIRPVHQTNCVYCQASIHFAIVQPGQSATPHLFDRKLGTGTPTTLGLPDFV